MAAVVLSPFFCRASVRDTLVPIAVVDTNRSGFAILTFAPSQRFYRLDRRSRSYKRSIAHFNAAFRDQNKVVIVRKSKNSDLIVKINKPFY